MVGSFAPVHEGHFDAMFSAERAMHERGEDVSSVVFAPNSDSYVSIKLNDKNGRWSFAQRVLEFSRHDPQFLASGYVDDITGVKPPEKSISEAVVENVQRRLGVEACKIVLVVGSDQVASMRPHLDTNRAICIIRPGSESQVSKHFEENWFAEAVANNQYMLSRRQNTDFDISSTDIRARLAGSVGEAISRD